jgi:hypothetical protein
VLHDSHYLNHVVAQIDNPGEDLVFEVGKPMHFLLYSTHPDMALVYFEVVVLPRRFGVLELVVV